MRFRQYTRTGLFVDDHPIVRTQFPGELIGAAIDRIDLGRTIGQQHVGKATGRTAYVDRDLTGHVDGECIKRVGKLDAPARDPGMVATAHVDRSVRRDLLTGFLDLAIAEEDMACQDQGLRAGAAFRQA